MNTSCLVQRSAQPQRIPSASLCMSERKRERGLFGRAISGADHLETVRVVTLAARLARRQGQRRIPQPFQHPAEQFGRRWSCETGNSRMNRATGSVRRSRGQNTLFAEAAPEVAANAFRP